MLTWWFCACRGDNNDSFEEVRFEPTSVAVGEARSGAESPNFESAEGRVFDTLSGGMGASRPLQEPVGPNYPLPTDAGLSDVCTPEPGGGGGADAASSGASDPTSTAAAPATETPVASCVADVKLEEAKIEQLKDATDNVRVWFRESLIRWRKLPIGDECDGEAFLDVASTIPTVYPSVFKLTYAVTYLTTDFADHVSTVRKTWPKGARSMREAVRMEVKAEGNEEQIGKKYWKTCSVRLLWICRTMRMFDVIMEVLAKTDETPITCGRTAVDRILTPYLSWTLKKIAEYIIGVCCWSTQVGCCNHVKVPPAEFKECLGLLYPLVRGHADALEQMLKAEIPSVFKKKC